MAISDKDVINNIKNTATENNSKKEKNNKQEDQNNKNDFYESIFEYDELKLYFGEDYIINDKIQMHQPTIGEIVKWGEREYYSMVYTLTCIPSDMKSQLEDVGINYMKISDFELFMILSNSLTPDQTRIIFGDLDFSKFRQCKNLENDELCLYDSENDIIIDRFIYMKIVDYLRTVHNIKPKIQNAANETTRKILIQLDRQRIAKSKNEKYKSQLKELISAMMRYPGFKYKTKELKECGLYEFMDSVQGAQIYVSTTALLQGMYSGMIDTSKINKKEFNWMRGARD